MTHGSCSSGVSVRLIIGRAMSRMRKPDHIPQTARCVKCGDQRFGVTTVEYRPWDRDMPRRDYHFCDHCSAEIKERPLQEVLLEYL